MNVLNVGEKPMVARTVATILSRNQNMRMREGRSRYNKIFEFNYTIRGQPCHMIFTSVTGHLMELEFDERYRKWHSCDPAALFTAPVHKSVPDDKKDIKRTLEEEARRCQRLVLWLDCDDEGENIAFEVISVCTAVNPRLTIERAHFSTLIDRDIHHAAQNTREPKKSITDAVDLRQEIDLRIGAAFTRFQTMLMKNAFVIDTASDDRNRVLSYGPCQFPTLGFVVERYWEIQAHEPEEFWSIVCSHESKEGIAEFSWMRGRLFDYTCAVIIYEMCVEKPMATVTNVRQEKKLKYPPYPLNTIELQKRASRYFRMSSDHTMKVAEELYQAGFISYPRTETDSFSSGTDLHTIVQDQQGHPEWGIYAQRLMDPEAGLWRNPRGGGHDDKAHPPIYPTKFSAGESGWSQDHRKLYELVVRHFLACVSKPAEGAETTVEINIAGELFSACGRVILEKNYLDVYRYESWGGSIIPTYTNGQQFNPTKLTLESGVTRPPPLLSEADLLSRMDKKGEKIGTDATMHDHIKKMLERAYATKDSSTRFTPTKLGEALVLGYDDIDMTYKLWRPDLRSNMEKEMEFVKRENKSKDAVLKNILEQMEACFKEARDNKVKLLEAMAMFFERSTRSGSDELHAMGVVRRCGLCQESDMVLRKNRDGNFMVGCLGYPQCRNAVWLPGSVSEAVVTTNTCNSCTPGPVYLIQFKFRRLEIPPNYTPNHLGCIGGCDEILAQLTEICGRGPRMPARPRGPTAPANNAHHTNPRQGACMNCRETGHSSTDCPLHYGNVQHRGTSEHNGEASVSCSSCGTPCVLRTANTVNNRGRKFYSCPSQECNFFVWEDSLNDGTGSRSVARSNSIPASNPRQTSGHGSRGRGGRGGQNGSRTANTTFVSATGDPISGRRCYTCGDPSHFANVCPNRGV